MMSKLSYSVFLGLTTFARQCNKSCFVSRIPHLRMQSSTTTSRIADEAAIGCLQLCTILQFNCPTTPLFSVPPECASLYGGHGTPSQWQNPSSIVQKPAVLKDKIARRRHWYDSTIIWSLAVWNLEIGEKNGWGCWAIRHYDGLTHVAVVHGDVWYLHTLRPIDSKWMTYWKS